MSHGGPSVTDRVTSSCPHSSDDSFIDAHVLTEQPLTAKPISSRSLSVTASSGRRKKAKSTWLRFAPVSSKQWAETPFTEINTFTLSSSNFDETNTVPTRLITNSSFRLIQVILWTANWSKETFSFTFVTKTLLCRTFTIQIGRLTTKHSVFIRITLGVVKFNFQRILLRWLLWLTKAHHPIWMQHSSTVL